jgi:hypothetical protein
MQVTDTIGDSLRVPRRDFASFFNTLPDTERTHDAIRGLLHHLKRERCDQAFFLVDYYLFILGIIYY